VHAKRSSNVILILLNSSAGRTVDRTC
jgi:hypothetical protein